MAQSNVEDDFNVSLDRNSSKDDDDSFDKTSLQTTTVNQDFSDDDLEIPLIKAKKRVQRFVDNFSDSHKTTTQNGDGSPLSKEEVILLGKPTLHNDSDSSSDTSTTRHYPRKSWIRNISSEEDSDSLSLSLSKKVKVALKNKEQQARMLNKRDKLRDKFKSLVNSRGKTDDNLNKDLESDDNCKSHYEQIDNQSQNSEEEDSSVEKLKQKIKERTRAELKMSICDPDTSDEESEAPKQAMLKYKKGRKSTKSTSPKPVRMSAKQAMENMQKIKSESNRMLREREVSLPYHRPKALSLKDIMSRRKPAVTADGKALPIKMNEEQLKQYALALEQRQKEMMELCKSESEEEDLKENENESSETQNDNGTKETTQTCTRDQDDKSAHIDKLYDCKAYEAEINDHIGTNVLKENSRNIDQTKFDLILKKVTNSDDKIVTNNETEINGHIGTNVQEQSSSSIDWTEFDLSLKKVTNSDDKIVTNNETEINGHIGTNVQEQSSSSIDWTEFDLSVKKVTNSDDKIVKQINVPKTVRDENNSQFMTLTKTYNEFSNDLSEEGNTSAEISLVYNDSVEENQKDVNLENVAYETSDDIAKRHVMSLDHVNNKQTVENSELTTAGDTEKQIYAEDIAADSEKPFTGEIKQFDEHAFSDDEVNMEDIDKLIENAEIMQTQSDIVSANSPMLINIKDADQLQIKPKLIGRPGMVIDLDGTDPYVPKKLTGVELLKERFTYFAGLKTPEELEREKEKRIKPGTQHIKLKQKLEEIIAEQRSLEWAKRLEQEKQNHMDLDVITGKDDDLDDIDKIEAKLEEKEFIEEESSEEEEVEEEIDLADIKEKPRKRNPLIADEAEESDCDDVDDYPGDENGDSEDDEDVADEEDTEDSSEESEDDQQAKPKKGRILKAFEDSDNEDITNVDKNSSIDYEIKENDVNKKATSDIKETQDEEIQLAQMHKSFSEDLFTSQESELITPSQKITSAAVSGKTCDDKDLATQTFSILGTTEAVTHLNIPAPGLLTVGCDTQPYEGDLDAVVGMCSGSFSQNLVTSQYPTTQSQSQIGEDVLALCTGQFYDSKFVSQLDYISRDKDDSSFLLENNKTKYNLSKDTINNSMKAFEVAKANDKEAEIHDDVKICEVTDNININVSYIEDKDITNVTEELNTNVQKDENETKAEENKLLTSPLDELNDPELKSTKPHKYFADNDNQGKENTQNVANIQFKKKFIIDSDDDGNDGKEGIGKRKKLKKKKMEQRALHISDEEEEESMSEIEDDSLRFVQYDSEENEVEVLPQLPKKKRKVAAFFEQEAELTSEDEWVGSGDEDERGLDRMEREEGDDETFNQATLQRELGQIHMRDVLDQDKRDVRMIQELLFEDGDLGGGGRQRKFRWRNADGEEETDTVYDELTGTQEDEFESEEQWRKQRHEREMYLKQMEQQQEENNLNTNVNRTTIIKANLNSKTLSSLLLDVNSSKTVIESPAPTIEKKTSKDIPSPKKPLVIFQQNYHGSLLSRGRGALARLAALATPLAADDDDAPKVSSLAPSSKRNFVFAAVTPDQKEPKITKRKAEANADTPRLVKKMRTQDKQAQPRNSLLDYIKI